MLERFWSNIHLSSHQISLEISNYYDYHYFFSAFNFHFFPSFIFSFVQYWNIVYLFDPFPVGLFRVNERNYWNKLYINRLRIPVGYAQAQLGSWTRYYLEQIQLVLRAGLELGSSDFKSRTWTTLLFCLLLLFFKRKKLMLESNKRSCLPDELYQLVILRLLS